MASLNTSNSKRVAINGLLLALTTITIFLGSVFPGLKITFYTISSFYIAVVIIEFGAINAWIFYLASCLLLSIIIPNKIMVLPFVLFFGIYGIVKYYCEKTKKRIFEYLLKIIFLNIFLLPIIMILGKQIFPNIDNVLPIWALIPIIEILFLVYDYIYTVFIRFYGERLRKNIKI